MPLELFFITSNNNKVTEVQSILGNTVKIEARGLDILEIQGSIEDISRNKCQHAAEVVNGPVLVEDTALCFTALKGLPGPYVKWFLEAVGPQGLHNLVIPYTDKSAQAICTFAYSGGPGCEPILFQGKTDGKIVDPRGSNGFGWDSCFEWEGKTYGEMNQETKDKISHRAKALGHLKRWLQEQV